MPPPLLSGVRVCVLDGSAPLAAQAPSWSSRCTRAAAPLMCRGRRCKTLHGARCEQVRRPLGRRARPRSKEPRLVPRVCAPFTPQLVSRPRRQVRRLVPGLHLLLRQAPPPLRGAGVGCAAASRRRRERCSRLQSMKRRCSQACRARRRRRTSSAGWRTAWRRLRDASFFVNPRTVLNEQWRFRRTRSPTRRGA